MVVGILLTLWDTNIGKDHQSVSLQMDQRFQFDLTNNKRKYRVKLMEHFL